MFFFLFLILFKQISINFERKPRKQKNYRIEVKLLGKFDLIFLYKKKEKSGNVCLWRDSLARVDLRLMEVIDLSSFEHMFVKICLSRGAEWEVRAIGLCCRFWLLFLKIPENPVFFFFDQLFMIVFVRQLKKKAKKNRKKKKIGDSEKVSQKDFNSFNSIAGKFFGNSLPPGRVTAFQREKTK